MDKLLGTWSGRFKRCLQIVAAANSDSAARVANVVLTGEGLVSSLAKLMATDLAAAVDIDNVYSTVKMSKESVLERVRTKFGKGCSFVVISMQAETQTLADSKRIPLWKIQHAGDLDSLYRALSHHLL
uniref:Eyes absent homolog n=1 Tax=Steinernema glaseri TaxID=37863 RepID=A0A1I8A837_9BILA